MSTLEPHAPGAPAAAGTVPLAVPDIGPAERAAVTRAVESGFVSSVGPAVREFEELFAAHVGARHAVACSSGTAALHVALRLLGAGRDDEVMCADFTFVGSVNPVAYQHARLTLVDAEWDTWGLDPEALRDELERRANHGEPMPAAVEVVHVLGQPARLAEILEVCERHAVPVVEDAAESLGARWTGGPLAGRHTGSVGRIGCYSFNGNKIVTAGGGGMIVTDDDDLAARARHLTTQAKVPDRGYLHDEVGYNYRMTNLAAALGVAQLSRLDEFVAAKQRIASTYDTAFDALPLTLPPRRDDCASTYWLYSILVEDMTQRDALLDHLDAAGIGARALWRPIRDQPPFSDSPVVGGDVARQLFERGVSLPCSTSLTDHDQERVIDAVTAFFEELAPR